MELFQLSVEEIINKLINSDLKLVEKETGIPYDRMYKWTKGKGRPKSEDTELLRVYFHGISSIATNNATDRTEELIAELRDRIKEKDDRLADKDKIIERTEESLYLWKEKAQGYEKKISTDVGALDTKKQGQPHVGRAGK